MCRNHIVLLFDLCTGTPQTRSGHSGRPDEVGLSVSLLRPLFGARFSSAYERRIQLPEYDDKLYPDRYRSGSCFDIHGFGAEHTQHSRQRLHSAEKRQVGRGYLRRKRARRRYRQFEGGAVVTSKSKSYYYRRRAEAGYQFSS